MDLLGFLQGRGRARRKVLAELRAGRIFVAGKKIENLREKLEIGQRVEIAGETRVVAEEKILKILVVLLNKPVGVECSHDGRWGPTIFDLLPVERARLKFAGRLDKNSRGLVVLSDAGWVIERLTHPRFWHEKEYFLETAAKFPRESLGKLKIGVVDAAEKLAVDDAELLADGRVRVVLHEGKKRHLRRLFGSLGFGVVDLLRWRVGAWTLNGIADGERAKLEFEKSDLEKILGGEEK